MRRVATFGVAVVLATAMLAACGSVGDDAMSRSARDQLAPMTANVRAALEAFDPARAAAAVSEVKQAVERLHDQGEIGDERAARLLSAVEGVERRLDLAPTTTTSSTTTTTVPPTDDKRGKRRGWRPGERQGSRPRQGLTP